MHTQPDLHSLKQANTQFNETGIRVGYSTSNEQLGSVAAVSACRDPDMCAATLRWQDPEAATPLEWQDPEAVIVAVMAGLGGHDTVQMAGTDGRYCR